MNRFSTATKSILISQEQLNAAIPDPYTYAKWIILGDEFWKQLKEFFVEEYKQDIINELAGIQEDDK